MLCVSDNTHDRAPLEYQSFIHLIIVLVFLCVLKDQRSRRVIEKVRHTHVNVPTPLSQLLAHHKQVSLIPPPPPHTHTFSLTE